MIAALSPPTTTLSDAICVVAVSFPAALIPHSVFWVALYRKIQGGDSALEPESSGPSVGARIRRFYWSVPSLLLAWLPFLVMALGNVGCSLLRDAGYQIFPWPMVSVTVLFAVAFGGSYFLRHRMIEKLATETRDT